MLPNRVGLKARSVFIAAVGTGTLIAAPPTVQAQQWVSGVVAEVETGERIEGAAVLLIGAEEAVVATALSDSAGRFEVPVAEPGKYVLRVSRAGYRPVRSSPIDVPAATTVQTRAHLSPNAVLLDPVTVVGEPQVRELEWFERRRRQRRGFSFDRADFERLRAGHVTDLLVWIPRSTAGSRGGLSLNFRRCEPAVFVDGRELHPINARYWISYAPLSPVYGVEVFRSWSDVPADFSAPLWADSRCGVIAVWTRWKMER